MTIPPDNLIGRVSPEYQEDHEHNLLWAESVLVGAKSIDQGSIAYLMTRAARHFLNVARARRQK